MRYRQSCLIATLWIVPISAVLAAPFGRHFGAAGGMPRHGQAFGFHQEFRINTPMQQAPEIFNVLKVGDRLPQQYQEGQQPVDYTTHPQLSQPNSYQQWIKIDGHYILYNILTETVIKVLPE